MGKLRDFLTKLFHRKVEFHKSKEPFFSVSVVILTYNGEEFLEKRLDSIIGQTLNPLEILILDDASTDRSVDIVREKLKDCRIPYRILINNENEGCGSQLIRGIHEAKGDFIWFAEQDDHCTNNFIEALSAMATENEEINLIYGKNIYVDATYGEVYRDEIPAYCQLGSEVIGRYMSVTNGILSLSGTFFRKTALDGIDEHVHSLKVFYDWLMNAYALREGFICYVPEACNYFYRHADSIIAKERRKVAFYEDLFMVKNFILDHFDVPAEVLNEVLYEVDRDYRLNGHAGYDSPEIKENPELGDSYRTMEKRIYELLYSQCV